MRTVSAGGLRFGLLEEGSGPLALCLHGFPDTAHTYRHLLPALAAAGFHAVAPFMRGYAPTDLAPDGGYGLDRLVADANALHHALGGDGDAVLVGHDWGAFASYGAAAAAPERWRRVVTLAVPPVAGMAGALLDYAQLRRSFYLFLFQTPFAEPVLAADDLAFVAKLWADWSPGYDAGEDVARVRESLATDAHRSAAIGYYRALLGDPAALADAFAVPPQPTLYLHGATDGCLGLEVVRDAAAMLSAGSQLRVVGDAGHFLHLERPEEVNPLIVAWVTR